MTVEICEACDLHVTHGDCALMPACQSPRACMSHLQRAVALCSVRCSLETGCQTAVQIQDCLARKQAAWMLACLLACLPGGNVLIAALSLLWHKFPCLFYIQGPCTANRKQFLAGQEIEVMPECAKIYLRIGILHDVEDGSTSHIGHDHPQILLVHE